MAGQPFDSKRIKKLTWQKYVLLLRGPFHVVHTSARCASQNLFVQRTGLILTHDMSIFETAVEKWSATERFDFLFVSVSLVFWIDSLIAWTFCVQRTGDLDALERLVRAELLTGGHQAGHLNLKNKENQKIGYKTHTKDCQRKWGDNFLTANASKGRPSEKHYLF